MCAARKLLPRKRRDAVAKKYTTAQIEDLLAIRCCHVTGSHNPSHNGLYVCYIQKAEAYDRIVSMLRLNPAGLAKNDLKNFRSVPDCYWCDLEKRSATA